MEKPKVGDVVHYRSYGSLGGEHRPACRAAIITEVDPYIDATKTKCVRLAVLNPEGMFFTNYLLMDNPSDHDPGVDDPVAGGTWHLKEHD